MRTQRERRHHGNAAQEEHDVSWIQIRKGLVQVDLVVGPLELPDHPERAAHGDKHPEEVSPPVRRTCIQKQAGIGQQRHEALHEIPEGVKRLRAALQRQRNR